METTRQQKIARLIQKELAEMFQHQTQAAHGLLCRAYLSVFPSEKSQEVVENINRNVKSVRYELGKRLRYQLRIIPELRFFVDDSLDYIEHIDELLK